jgi:hypothetical protein
VPRRINQGRGLSRVRFGLSDAQLFGQSRTLRIKQLLGLTGSTGWFDLAVPAGTIVHTPIFIVFRGPQAYLNSCGNRPVRRANFFKVFSGHMVTDYSEHIGNTFGPKGFAIGSSLPTSSSK